MRLRRPWAVMCNAFGVRTGGIGLSSIALAPGFAALVLDKLLEIKYHPNALTNILAVLISAVTAAAAGWLASFRILGRKPLEILREE